MNGYLPPELPLFAMVRRPKSRGHEAENVHKLISALRGHGWVSKTRLCADLCMTDREVRQAAADSGGQVIAHSGRRGYALTLEASLADVLRAEADSLSRSTKCKQRYLDIARVRHTRPDCAVGGAA